MSKILSIFLRAIKFVGIVSLSGTLSGCLFASDYLYILHIENRLATPIFYCYDNDGKNCADAIAEGSNAEYSYISRGDESSDEDMYKEFDRKKIKICGKLVDFKRIRSVSPIVKSGRYRFDIVIDKAVGNVFCR